MAHRARTSPASCDPCIPKRRYDIRQWGAHGKRACPTGVYCTYIVSMVRVLFSTYNHYFTVYATINKCFDKGGANEILAWWLLWCMMSSGDNHYYCSPLLTCSLMRRAQKKLSSFTSHLGLILVYHSVLVLSWSSSDVWEITMTTAMPNQCLCIAGWWEYVRTYSIYYNVLYN